MANAVTIRMCCYGNTVSVSVTDSACRGFHLSIPYTEHTIKHLFKLDTLHNLIVATTEDFSEVALEVQNKEAPFDLFDKYETVSDDEFKWIVETLKTNL
jgi:hypothetical protein